MCTGAEKLTNTEVSVGLAATTAIGASGTVPTGVGSEAAVEVPAALVATTVNVYVTPSVRPAIVQKVVVDAVQLPPPGEAVTV